MLDSKRSPIVSVIVVTWNSAVHLPRCLAALCNQSFHDFEVLIVDNGSNDGCVDDLARCYPALDIRLERLSTNTGFAVANNIGARLARGRWLALLNADAFPEPDWLEQLLKAAGSFPEGYFFASRQLQANEPSRLDGEGDVFHVSGLAWRHNFGFPVYTSQGQQSVFSACGAAAMFPRQVFLNAGGFDEDYFSYFEDVDLGFRLRLQGLQCILVPTAVVHHIGSASTGRKSDFAIYFGHRNLEWTYVKNMPAALLWLYLPLHILMNLFYLGFFILNGQGRAICRAKWDSLLGLGPVLRKRKLIQLQRKVSASMLHKAMSRGLLEPFRQRAKRRSES